MICDNDFSVMYSIKSLINKISGDKKINIYLEESNNGIECLYKIFKDFVNGIKYEAILIDENMPVMKGSNFIIILNNLYSQGYLNKIRMISMSSLDDIETIKILKSQGSEEILPKPLNKETLSIFIDSIIS